MKRLFAFVLAIALVFSLSVPVFATTTTGTITISNATIGQTYDVYKIFDATYNNTLGAISYTMKTTDKFYDAMFGSGSATNLYFDYNSNTGEVSLRSAASAGDIIAYLNGLADSIDPDHSAPAVTDELQFTGLTPGYYLVDRGSASTITLTSTTPDATIIDKNQQPGDNFAKQVLEGTEWVTINDASVGDDITFRVPFTATNYDGDKQVLHYIVHDQKTNGLWVEFESIRVYIDDEVDFTPGTENAKTKGYYFCVATNPEVDTGDWQYLGDWGVIDPTNPPSPDEADWYLIHKDFNEFEIIIPWVEGYDFEGNDAQNTYTLTYPVADTDPETLTTKNEATSYVIVTYDAAVGPEIINGNVTNTATLQWLSKGNDNPDGENPSTTTTTTYGMGITKVADDGTSRLAGATFELYKDENCTVPVYLIPIEENSQHEANVFIVDDILNDTTGLERPTVRSFHSKGHTAELIQKYLAGATESVVKDDETYPVRYDVTTPVEGRVIILGLDKGTYYLKETVAPLGYNKLELPRAVVVGSGTVTTEGDYSFYNSTIINNSGAILPSTGGQGTVMLITIGTMVALAFAVLLITHKKMSVYVD